MSTARAVSSLRALREQALWQLLAATKAPAIMALLRAAFGEAELLLAGSVLHERVSR